MSKIEKKTKELHDALEKKGPFASLIQIISGTDRPMREKIGYFFEDDYSFKGTLDEIIDEKIGDYLGIFLKKIFKEREDVATEKIKNALGIFSADEEPIYEMLFNYPKWLKDEIVKRYNKETGNDLLEEMKDNFIDPVKKNLELFLNTERKINDKKPDLEKCEKMTTLLKDVEPSEWMNNEEIMKNFASMSPEELVVTIRDYKNETGKLIFDDINELNPTPKKFLNDLLYYTICPPEKYAKILNDVFNKPVANEETIIDIFASRIDVDMDLIKSFYKKKYNNDLEKDLEAAYPGDFSKFLTKFNQLCAKKP